MATQDRSPSLFLGQSWASWADKMSISDGKDDEDKEKSDAKDDGDCMKLNKKDMDLFGYCPSTDEFMLVQCEACNMLLKPQALKRHIESRHGTLAAVTSSSEQLITSKALNSELAKTLSLPVTSFGKTSTTNKPPTKASLKQVPSSIRMLGNSASSASGENANCRVNSSSRMFRKGNTNPVVKMERISKDVAALKKVTTTIIAASNSPSMDVTSTSSILASATPGLSANGFSSADSDKSVTNGAMLKQALRTSLSSVTTFSTTAVTTLATQPLTLTTTTTSITYTRPATATVPTTTTSLTVLSKSGKPVPAAALSSALAATLTATTTPLKSNPHTSVTSSKSKKSPKERKFLPCKDREFDPNKHCGVVTDDASKPCTRSLTCKTHALGLRRAVPGRKKSFDDLLKDHKAAKEALLKAKAEEQAAATGGVAASTNAAVTGAPTLVTAVSSPSALAAMSAFKLGPSEVSGHRDIKSAATALLSQSALSRAVKPQRGAYSAVFQRLAPGGTLPSSVTVKEEASPVSELSSRLSQQSSESRLPHCSEKDGESKDEKQDVAFINHHPQPAAKCVFGARVAKGGGTLFSRRTDLVRAAFLSALERQLNPPPHKKLCVESKLPKEPQMSINSKDPYEFSMVDSGLAHQRPTVSFTISGPVNANSGLLGKPLLKHKAKSLSSHSLSVTGLAVSSGVSATPTTIAIPTLAAALLKPTKGPETSAGTNITGLPRGTVSLTQPLTNQSMKRKRSSSQITGTPASGTIQLQGTGVGLAVATGAGVNLAGIDGGRVSQQQSAVLTPASSVNSHSATTPLTAITIPSINLANAATLGLSAALPTSKQGPGQKASVIKDFSLVLTGIDPSLVNGQYLNITGTQLAELAAVQAVNATAEDKNIKRSRLTTNKHTTQKISGTLETLRALQGSSVLTAVPPNAVLVDGTLQGAVLAPVSSLGAGGNGGGNSTLVTLTSSTATTSQSCSSITVTPNTILRTESGTPQQVTLTSASFTNGIIPSAGDKVHVSTGSSSHSQQQHRLTSGLQGQTGSVTTAKTLQASGLLQAQGTPLCPSPALTQLAHFKPGTLNITKGGKITMQPMSVTIPVVNTVGLGSLSTTQQPNPHPQPALLVTTSAEDGRVGGGVAGLGKTEIQIQPHISGTSSGVIS
ncbi:uncharacterized protein LOC143284758 isoform X2 [Babylonia areolata]|uniref:uncharacterized protein LOC143284758 isoform X2 n=1 Tax=Babylonia areolata TaxID=304850 RepID=UPI003FD279A8